MFYRPPGSRVGRLLRRLWEVEVYDGDPDDPGVTTTVETAVAWNAVDATRMGGNVAKPPVAICWVSWPVNDEDPRIYKVYDTSGPTDELVTPTLGITAYDGKPPVYTDGTKAEVQHFEGDGYKSLREAAKKHEEAAE